MHLIYSGSQSSTSSSRNWFSLVQFTPYKIGVKCMGKMLCNLALYTIDCFFKKMGYSRPLFLYFRLFNTGDGKQFSLWIVPKNGWELRTSGVGSNCSTNWATTTSYKQMTAWTLISSLSICVARWLVYLFNMWLFKMVQ